ncbi:MAG: PAS domain-containing sensor histidine kinase [Verrucomicrobiota bacterium]|jgi:PAS domain S-box-containing protein
MKTTPFLPWNEVAAVALLATAPLQGQGLNNGYASTFEFGAMGGIIMLLLAWTNRLRRQLRDREEPVAAQNQAAAEGKPEFLRALMEHATDRIYFKDRASRFLLCNKAKCDKAGLRPEEIIGKTDFDLFDDRRLAQTAYQDEQEILRTGDAVCGRIYCERSKNGEEQWVLTTKWPLRDKEGSIIGTFGISKDITDLKQAEAKLEQAREQQLVETCRLAGMAETASTLLHNVGNVLNSVNVSASIVAHKVKNSRASNLGKAVGLMEEQGAKLGEFLASDAKGRQLPGYLAGLARHLEAEQREMLGEISSLCANVEHIKEIVAMQQAYSEVAGVQESLPPTELVEDALRLNAGSMERHHVQVRREYTPTPPLLVDKHKVLQVLVNLIRNAKYALDDCGQAEKRLILRVGPGEGATVRFSVVDNGIGIPAGNLKRIFERGFTTRKGGHGLGLHSGALAARQLGGSLTCQSEGAGKGAIFTLELPLAGGKSNA